MSRVSTTVYLDQDQIDELNELQQRRGIPKAVTIRRGVELALREARAWSNLESEVEDEIEKREKVAAAIVARRG